MKWCTGPAEGSSVCASVRLPGLMFPKSAYRNYSTSLPLFKERKALETFLGQEDVIGGSGADPVFTQYELHDFSIYRPESKNSQSGELAPLHHLCAKSANNAYYFDGILANGETRRYVQKVPFDILSVGNYLNTDLHTVGDQVWVQSLFCKNQDIWYQLKNPTPEYKIYHEEFLWIANFTKHFVDFLDSFEKVTLHHFRHIFHDWLIKLHGSDIGFQRWFSTFNRADFRTVVAANVDFLWKEAYGVNKSFGKHPIWGEVDPKKLTAVKEHHFKNENTVVTPYVYECFKRFPFGQFFNVVKQSSRVLSSRRDREIDLDLTVENRPVDFSDIDGEDSGSSVRPRKSMRARQEGNLQMLDEFFDENCKLGEDEAEEQYRIAAKADRAKANFEGLSMIQPTRLRRDSNGRLLPQKPVEVNKGDVVMVKPDFNSVWRGKSDLWYAYVQDIDITKKGRRHLKVIWLYQPSDTSCSTVFYPIPNELFFSGHCNCGDAKFDAEEVLFKPSVAFFSNPGESGAEYFVRQKYENEEASFVTLKQSDFQCNHYKPIKSPIEEAKGKYSVNDTVYIATTVLGSEWCDRKRKFLLEEKVILEPVQLVEFKADGQILVRQLARRGRDYEAQQGVRPNELVYTENLYPVAPGRIDRKCHIRYYSQDQKANNQIPAPYCRDGTADAYYITCREVIYGDSCRLEPLVAPFPAMNEGFDPNQPLTRPVLSGMDLFCGGGTFGRGLEEGGAIKNMWAVDIGRDQIHTYRANLKDTGDTSLYFGSVNDILGNALRGHFSQHVPEPGKVDFISAGSPCQGFSNANNHKGNETALRNCSLVASVAAFVDFYRPKYALLENVTGMASGPRDQNVFSQLLCTLVGMGYQVQQFNLDAWSFGSPQSRSRLFVSIAAPGLTLPPHPPLTHRHPVSKKDRSIGTGSNGLKFGQRRFETPVFEFLTAAEGTKDLPYIGQARTGTCIRFPDHRPSSTQTSNKCILMSSVPVNPRQQSFNKAVKSGRMPRSIVAEYSWRKSGLNKRIEDRSWQRINPDDLMGTIKTAATAACAFTGAVMHWEEHRILSVQEARRAQSFPDHEVLIGVPSIQWKIVGNSVARTVALALGMSLRQAWLSNDEVMPSHAVQRIQVESGPTYGIPTPCPTSRKRSYDDLELLTADPERKKVKLFAAQSGPFSDGTPNQQAPNARSSAFSSEGISSDGISVEIMTKQTQIRLTEFTSKDSSVSIQKRKRDNQLNKTKARIYIDISSDDSVDIETSNGGKPMSISSVTESSLAWAPSPTSPPDGEAPMSISTETNSPVAADFSPVSSNEAPISMSTPPHKI